MDTLNDKECVFVDLPADNDGEKIVYTVAEDEVSGYTTEVSGNVEEGFVVTNTHEPEPVATMYTITFDANGGAFADGKKTVVIEGIFDSVVAAPADPAREGYIFDGWDKEVPAHMPDTNPVIKAKWHKNTAPEVIAVTGITVTPETLTMATETKQTLKAVVTPADATNKNIIWTSSDPTVATVDKNGVVTALSYGKAVITAKTEDGGYTASCTVQTRFYDVNGSNVKGKANYEYYWNAVYWAADNNVTRGYGKTFEDGTKVPDSVFFGPKRKCTRREMIIFLWRISGEPEATGTMPFTDIGKYSDKSKDSYKAMLWGYKNGIIKGYESGKYKGQFRPDDPVVRKDTMIMLYRVAGKPKARGKMKYPDVAKLKLKTNSDTYTSIVWGGQTGIIGGYADGTFRPMDDCLREHIVTFIWRYVTKVK